MMKHALAYSDWEILANSALPTHSVADPYTVQIFFFKFVTLSFFAIRSYVLQNNVQLLALHSY